MSLSVYVALCLCRYLPSSVSHVGEDICIQLCMCQWICLSIPGMYVCIVFIFTTSVVSWWRFALVIVSQTHVTEVLCYGWSCGMDASWQSPIITIVIASHSQSLYTIGTYAWNVDACIWKQSANTFNSKDILTLSLSLSLSLSNIVIAIL